MKKSTLLFFLTWNTFTGFCQIDKDAVAPQHPLDLPGNFLLKTHWGQGGIYTRYAPEDHVQGCWSTALAQILYYHRLKPSGVVDYTCSKGYRIQENLSGYDFIWNEFENRITANSPIESIEAVSKYSYFTAVAIHKDFGTGKYREMVNPGPLLEKHFNCITEFYGSFTGKTPFNEDQLKAIAQKENIRHLIGADSVRLVIKREIDERRPVYLHIGNFTTYGHSTVIDGYQEKDNIFYVHINYGSGGFRTGWYDLFKPIDVEDDINLRAFITIKPGK